MKIVMRNINRIESAMRPNSSDIVVECHMNEGQMKEALMQFLEHVSGETWQSWIDEINEDAPNTVSVPVERPLTYLAAPYSHPDRAVRLARFDAINKAAAELMSQGLLIYSPISHTHPIAEAGALPLGWDLWQTYDRAFIEHSNKVIVLQLDGWRESKGVTAEIAIAIEKGITVEYKAMIAAAPHK